VNDRDYSRALLNNKALVEIKKSKFLTIDEVRLLVDKNTAKENQDIRGENYQLDGEVIHIIDIQIDYPVFVTDDNIYSRDELIARYPFDGLRTTPETVFSQQELAVFPPSRSGSGPEYVIRDLGSEEPFMAVDDRVKRAIRGASWVVTPPSEVVLTKVFVGRTKWKTFLDAQRFFNVVNDFIAPALTAGPGTPTLTILDLVGRMSGVSMSGAGLLEDGSAGKDAAKK
jgi:hypothetical protein